MKTIIYIVALAIVVPIVQSKSNNILDMMKKQIANLKLEQKAEMKQPLLPMSFDCKKEQFSLSDLRREALSVELMSVGFGLLKKIGSFAYYYIVFRFIIRTFHGAMEKSRLLLERDPSSPPVSVPYHRIPSVYRSLLRPNVSLTEEELEILSAIKPPSGRRDTENDPWSSLGGLQHLKKEFLQNFLPFLDTISSNVTIANNTTNTTTIGASNTTDILAIAASSAIPLTSYHASILLYGPPGCGKTQLIQGLLRNRLIHYPTLEITPSLLYRKYYGESNQLVKAIFTLAGEKLQTGCIFLIDEVDAFFRTRSQQGGGGGNGEDSDTYHDRALKMEFLQLWDEYVCQQKQPKRQLDNKQQLQSQEQTQTQPGAHQQQPLVRNPIFVFAMTNRPQDVDNGLLRRFDRAIYIPLPDITAREEIFRRLLRTVQPKERHFDYAACARMTEGYASSDIAGLVKTTLMKRQQRRQQLPSGAVGQGQGQRGLGEEAFRVKEIEEVRQSYYPATWMAHAYGRGGDQSSFFPTSSSSATAQNPYHPQQQDDDHPFRYDVNDYHDFLGDEPGDDSNNKENNGHNEDNDDDDGGQ